MFFTVVRILKDQWLVIYLRPSKIDGAKHAWAIRDFAAGGYGRGVSVIASIVLSE
ncbi:hypothetical protein ACFL17_06995 [Pseudomonadota bacterium]